MIRLYISETSDYPLMSTSIGIHSFRAHQIKANLAFPVETMSALTSALEEWDQEGRPDMVLFFTTEAEVLRFMRHCDIDGDRSQSIAPSIDARVEVTIRYWDKGTWYSNAITTKGDFVKNLTSGFFDWRDEELF